MESSSKPLAHIRRATNGDLPRILLIEHSAPKAAHWSVADYEIALTSASPPRLLLVAEIERQVEGFLVARSAYASEWEIENVVVAETARRSGVGVSLLEIFLEQARAQKQPDQALTIHLEVRESNLAARRLYEKSGFRLDTSRTKYYCNPEEDALLYSLSLQ
jgi:ribosomal-protein-alanine N-acetyltransferase